MIIVKLIGGLGNQMFQYAVGRRLAYIHKTILKLDISEFKSYRLRKYELDCFRLNADFATHDEIKRYVRIPNNLFFKFFLLLFPSFKKKNKLFYEEKFYHFDPNVLSLPDDAYLSGYWHSEKYFIDIEDIIREEFTVKCQPDNLNRNILRQTQSTNSVGIHVRLGDYIADPNTYSLHGFYGIEYIKQAVSIISKKIADPYFYVFSDDIFWAKKNLRLKFPVIFVSNNIGKKDCEDLRLMSKCKHNIIVNSTFGWWGAWLNKNKDKIVITPGKWYKDGPVDTQDLIPKSWLTI